MRKSTVEERVMRLEELMADVLRTLAATNEQLARTDAQIARTNEQLARTDEQIERLKEQIARTDERLEALFTRTDAQIARTDEQIERLKEQIARTDERLEALFTRTDAQIARTNEQLARTDEQLAQAEQRATQHIAQIEASLQRMEAEGERTSQELRAFKEESRRLIRDMRRQWGELANKMGTMAEDLVAPSIPRILRMVVGCPEDTIDSVAVRVRRRHPKTRQVREFDVIATCGEYLLVNETKSELHPRDIRTFVKRLQDVRTYFPEYADRKIIGCIASLYVDPSLVRFGERQGLVVLGFGEDVMDVLNSPGFVPRTF